jgi:hypothetical protein
MLLFFWKNLLSYTGYALNLSGATSRRHAITMSVNYELTNHNAFIIRSYVYDLLPCQYVSGSNCSSVLSN